DRQIQETIETEITGLAEQYRERGLPGLVDVIHDRSAMARDRKSLYLLTDTQFRRLAGNLIGWPDMEPDQDGWLRFPIERFHAAEGPRLSEALGRSFVLTDGYNLLVGRSVQDANAVKSIISQAIGWGMAVTVLFGVMGGLVTSRQMLQRVESLSRTVRRIMGGDMTQRMALAGSGDEFDQLAESLNRMLDEIERLMANIREVTDNVAHDLRTPLNRLRSRIDATLLAQGDAEAYRVVLEQTLADADHLLATFNAILTIAQAEAGSRLNRFETLDLAALAGDVAELYEPVAEDKGIHLDWRHVGRVVPVLGDRHLLSQALANLIDNAVKYVPSGGTVTVTVGPGAMLSVGDNGPGIPAEMREKVLERFVRLDSTRGSPGNGLGLSLVQAVARLHGARLFLEDNEPGLRVRLVFSHGLGCAAA
ncbi:MAG: HAMP domain-containing histidine kinase, partial [Rhodospirillales bacterium]|nr:HAMP domain-containing histidine kinase [Rhodospirillales bacterium]